MPATTRLSTRIVVRLAQAEACEPDPHYRDDLKIARLTVAYAANGEAVLCSAFELATYMVLGLHPSKVWSAIQARRDALGSFCGPFCPEVSAPSVPKKPAQSVTLWFEKTNAARATNPRGGDTLLRDNTISVPMAAPSIAALFPKSDASSSAKKREYTYREWLRIIRHSFAPQPLRLLTLNALTARGPWPGKDGPADSVICVALGGMMIGDDECGGQCVRSTAQRRLKRAIRENYWRRIRDANSWTNCPKCEKPRTSAKCEACGYRGRSKNGDQWTGEFMRVPAYEIDLDAFLKAPAPKGIREFRARTWKEHKEAAKRGEHPNVTEMPRKPALPTPPDPPPATAAPLKQPAAEHAHRNPTREAKPKLSKTETQKFVADLVVAMRGNGKPPGRTEPDPDCARCGGKGETEHQGHPGTTWRCFCWAPPDPSYRPKLSLDDAMQVVAERWRRHVDVARDAIKFYGYSLPKQE